MCLPEAEDEGLGIKKGHVVMELSHILIWKGIYNGVCLWNLSKCTSKEWIKWFVYSSSLHLNSIKRQESHWVTNKIIIFKRPTLDMSFSYFKSGVSKMVESEALRLPFSYKHQFSNNLWTISLSEKFRR